MMSNTIRSTKKIKCPYTEKNCTVFIEVEELIQNGTSKSENKIKFFNCDLKDCKYKDKVGFCPAYNNKKS